MSENKNGAGFYTGLFLGSIAGLTMGILFAPKSGEETRSIISDKTSDWKEKAEELSEATKERIISATNEGRKVAGEMRDEDYLEDI
ncbi:MAG: hypothetical protein CL764_03520 [Chloroflexi bacterium]|nr:hypothetical protein [Chloroflexota bacterium]|tara:strand:- start:250 stop:507 length:258 start_codon:yes stop_codon:yes gene_type:complete